MQDFLGQILNERGDWCCFRAGHNSNPAGGLKKKKRGLTVGARPRGLGRIDDLQPAMWWPIALMPMRSAKGNAVTAVVACSRRKSVKQQSPPGRLELRLWVRDGKRPVDLLSPVGWYGYASAQISDRAVQLDGQVAWTSLVCPRRKRYAVIHGGHHDIARFIWPVRPRAGVRRRMASG